MSTAARVAKNTGYLYAKMDITMFISLYTTRLILNSLGTSDFGIFNIVGGAIAMLGFLNAAMAGATQRFMSYTEGEGDKEKQKKIFNISIILHAGISVIVGVVLLCAGYIFFNGVLNIPADRIFAAQVVYGSLIVSTMFTVMSVPYDAMLNAHENMRYYAIVGIIESLLKLSVAFVVVYTTSDKLIMYGILMAAIPLITLSIMRIYCHRKYAECVLSPRRYFDRSLMKEMTGFAGWNSMSSITAIGSQYGLGIVLNHFWGTTLNAAQGVGNQLCGQLQAFSNNLLKAVNPVIGKSAGENNREKLINTSFYSSKAAYILMALLGLPAIVEMDSIMNIWLGNSGKNIPQYAALFCQLQITRTLVENLTISQQSAILAYGRIKLFMQIKAILYILPIPLTYIAFYFSLPPYWLYIIWILCWGVFMGVSTLYTLHLYTKCKINQWIKLVFVPCIVPTIMAIACGYLFKYLLDIDIYYKWIYISIIVVVTYIVGNFFFLSSEEKQAILKLKNKYQNKI